MTSEWIEIKPQYVYKVDGLSVHLSRKDRRTSSYMVKPYAYMVMQRGAHYVAFVHWSSFRRWLKERNLKLQGNCIVGHFHIRHVNALLFHCALGERDGVVDTRVLDNGEYKPARITYDEKGVATVHVLYVPYTGEIQDIIEKLREYERYDKIYG